MAFPTYQRPPKRPPGVTPVIRAEDLTLDQLQRRYHVMFAQHFGIKSREWDYLYLDEVADHVSACDQILAASRREAASFSTKSFTEGWAVHLFPQ